MNSDSIICICIRICICICICIFIFTITFTFTFIIYLFIILCHCDLNSLMIGLLCITSDSLTSFPLTVSIDPDKSDLPVTFQRWRVHLSKYFTLSLMIMKCFYATLMRHCFVLFFCIIYNFLIRTKLCMCVAAKHKH